MRNYDDVSPEILIPVNQEGVVQLQLASFFDPLREEKVEFGHPVGFNISAHMRLE